MHQGLEGMPWLVLAHVTTHVVVRQGMCVLHRLLSRGFFHTASTKLSLMASCQNILCCITRWVQRSNMSGVRLILSLDVSHLSGKSIPLNSMCLPTL